MLFTGFRPGSGSDRIHTQVRGERVSVFSLSALSAAPVAPPLSGCRAPAGSVSGQRPAAPAAPEPLSAVLETIAGTSLITAARFSLVRALNPDAGRIEVKTLTVLPSSSGV
ncbi:hypothetical protein MHYP_G00287480 [Metynnis hypsauchen]